MIRRPFRTALATALLVAAPLAACGDDDEAASDEPETTSSSEQRDETTTTEEEEPAIDPEAALLTLEDLPPGYAASEDDEEEDEDDGPTDSCPQLEALDRDDVDPVAKAQSEFTAGQAGPIVQHQVSVLEPGVAEERLAEFRSAFEDPACTSFSQTNDAGRTATYTLAEVPVPQLGDETLGMRITGDATALSATIDIVLERVGDVGSYLTVTSVPDLGGPPAPPIEPLARLVDEKLQGA